MIVQVRRVKPSLQNSEGKGRRSGQEAMSVVLGSKSAVKAVAGGETNFKRGEEILVGGKLQKVELEGEQLVKGSAICKGSSPGDEYSVSFELDPGAPTKVHSHKCSCPATAHRSLCKHVVALLLARVETIAGMSPEELNLKPTPKQKSTEITANKTIIKAGEIVRIRGNDEKIESNNNEKIENNNNEKIESSINVNIVPPRPPPGRRVLPLWMQPKPEKEKKEKKIKEKPPKVPKPAPLRKPRGAKKGVVVEKGEEEEDSDEELRALAGQMRAERAQEGKSSPLKKTAPVVPNPGRGHRQKPAEDKPRTSRGRKPEEEISPEPEEERPRPRTFRGRKKSKAEKDCASEPEEERPMARTSRGRKKEPEGEWQPEEELRPEEELKSEEESKPEEELRPQEESEGVGGGTEPQEEEQGGSKRRRPEEDGGQRKRRAVTEEDEEAVRMGLKEKPSGSERATHVPSKFSSDYWKVPSLYAYSQEDAQVVHEMAGGGGSQSQGATLGVPTTLGLADTLGGDDISLGGARTLRVPSQGGVAVEDSQKTVPWESQADRVSEGLRKTERVGTLVLEKEEGFQDKSTPKKSTPKKPAAFHLDFLDNLLEDVGVPVKAGGGQNRLGKEASGPSGIALDSHESVFVLDTSRKPQGNEATHPQQPSDTLETAFLIADEAAPSEHRVPLGLGTSKSGLLDSIEKVSQPLGTHGPRKVSLRDRVLSAMGPGS